VDGQEVKGKVQTGGESESGGFIQSRNTYDVHIAVKELKGIASLEEAWPE